VYHFECNAVATAYLYWIFTSGESFVHVLETVEAGLIEPEDESLSKTADSCGVLDGYVSVAFRSNRIVYTNFCFMVLFNWLI